MAPTVRSFAPLALLPRRVLGILHEVSRHLLRRPVVGVCAVARTGDGRVLLVRRADTGTWALPGGTLEWGEQASASVAREIAEETGARFVKLGRVTGVYSRPDRDPRFHAVTICVTAEVVEPVAGPRNTLEIREARLFAPGEVPGVLAMGTGDMLADALKDSPGVRFE